MDEKDIKYDIDVRDDGVYLVITRPHNYNKELDFITLKNFIDENGVIDWNFQAVNEALNSKDDRSIVKISANTVLKKVDESVNILISKDKMFVEAVFVNAKNGGKKLTLDDFTQAINASRVSFGLDDNLTKIFENREYGIIYVVAKGKKAENGTNGRIVYHFNTEKKSYKPKVLESGKVDYQNLNLYEVASAGQKLVTIIPPTEGENGINVLGEQILAAKGKAAVAPKGKNVHIDEDGVNLIADIDGQILLENSKISIHPVLEIRSDVDNTTGNINFLGAVIVRGNVLTGFSVTASGNIEIYGVVEGALIKSNADIIIKGGVQGLAKGKLIAQGDITAKFIENCNIEAKGNITADAIMHSEVKSTGKIILTGKRGLLVGGKIRAFNSVEAITVGSHMATTTEIQVGLDPEAYEKYNELRKEHSKQIKEFLKYEQVVEVLAKLKDTNQLTAEKRSTLIKALQLKSFLKSKIDDLQSQIDEITPSLDRNTGTLKVQNFIHPGVKVTLGNAILYVRETITHCTLYNDSGEIKIGEY